ncbi:MAG TPA: 2-hydroxyacyl-CoA dehydratase family protein [Steroidobacteraceae bacterium]
MSVASIEQRLKSPLEAARNENARGRRVIGYIGDDVPVELILAADALPLRLIGTPRETPQADRYLESSFGPASRAILESWLCGELDFLDAIVFPRSNDTAQRLYYYVCELQRRKVHGGPRALIYDIARIDRETSRAYHLEATRRLASELGASPSRLVEARARLLERVALIESLSTLRRGEQALPGSSAMQAGRSLQLDWTTEFDSTVRDWLSTATRYRYERRLLLAGSTPPDERLHRAAEDGGANVVYELFDESPALALSRWSRAANTIEELAQAYWTARSAATTLLRDPDVLVERAREIGANGVILWLVEEDEGIVWEVPRQLQRLRRAGLPVLSLVRQRWSADASVLDRIKAFAGNLQVP